MGFTSTSFPISVSTKCLPLFLLTNINIINALIFVVVAVVVMLLGSATYTYQTYTCIALRCGGLVSCRNSCVKFLTEELIRSLTEILIEF